MALVTVQRSPSPSASAETDELDTGQDTVDGSSLKSPRNRSFSENYFTVKGAALILPQSDYETAFTRKVTKSHGGDIQSHLQSMFSLLRPLDTIKVAVKLEAAHDRYLALVSCMGKQDTEESVVLGMDLRQDATTIGLIMPIWAHTYIKLDGDGGFSITSNKETHSFKPVSVQAMWSALQSLNKCLKIANDNLYIPGGLTHTWIGFYDSKRSTDYQVISEWNTTSDIDKSYRTDTTSTDSSDEGSLYKRIKTELKLVMMSVDLEEVTCKFLRESLEKTLDMNLRDYRSFIDTEMFEILGQMDAPSQIQDYLYLGSEWNASNIEELQKNGVHYILNVSREIDNFYPGILHYMNVREWDIETADLLKHWEETHRFISRARKHGKVLVHCKMGISRSASTVIAHLMKENRWSRDQAFEFTKEKRSIINPNSGFWKQLETYEGIVNARWKYIENVNNPVSGGLAPTDETEEQSDLETAFPRTAEDLVAMKLGKDADDFNDYQHIFNTEQDIELSSRSADSTEESLPDERSPQPADESAQGATGGAFLYPRKKKGKSSSGDFLETDSSDDTDSEELTDEDEDNNNAFRPIEVPKIDIQKPAKSKGRRRHDVKKVEARRCKSESDKHTLTVDNKVSGMSRDGSVSKFKPDQSWIKLHQSDEELEQQIHEPMDTDQDRDSIAGVKHEEEDGLWMGEIRGVSEESDVKESGKTPAVAGNVDDAKISAERDSSQIDLGNEKDMEDTKCAISDKEKEIVDEKKMANSEVGETLKETSAKESIPVASGLVQKQKQDFEVKLKSAGHTKTASLGSTDLQILCQLEKVRKDSETASISSFDQEVKMDALSNADTKTGDIEGNTESAMEVDPPGDEAKSEMSQESTQQPKMRSRLSVYDLEEIDLPEDYVKRTKQQIENRLSVESPRRRIQRSSSLKSKRVTPKAKDRDNERRKTCIAVLSPTSSDNSMRDEIKSPDQGEAASEATEGKFSSDQSDMEDFSVTSPGDAEAGEEDKLDETGMVKVYKYMGEELTVQEGLVKKQTLDIEQKATGAPCNRPPSRLDTEMEHSGRSSESPSVCSITSEHSDKTRETDTSSIYSGVSIESSTDKNIKISAKDSGLSLGAKLVDSAKTSSHETGHSKVLSSSTTDTKIISENRVETKDLEIGEEIDSATSTEPAKTFDSIRANFQDKDERMETDLAGTSVVSTPAKKWGARKQTSRFDAETLELIREIGSALMNSPAKVEVEETDTPLESGRGLVKNFVRNIEREVWVSRKKKAAREIIIVDKGSALEDTEACGAKLSPVKPLPTQICDSKSEITNAPSPKRSPGSKTPPASNSPVAKKPSSPNSITSSPETVQTHRNSPVAKLDMVQKPDTSNLSLNLKSEGSKSEQSDKHDKQTDRDSDSEPCSVKNLVGKFETPSGKTTPVSMIFGCVGSPSASNPSLFGASHDIELIEKKDGSFSSGASSVKSETTKSATDISGERCLSPKAETTRSFHDPACSHTVSPKSTKPRFFSDIPSNSAFSKPSQSPGSSRKIMHRQSEPDIRLSEKNIQLLDTKLREVGTRLIPSACIIESEEEDTDSAQDSTVPSFLVRSRSEDQAEGPLQRRERRARMIGAKSKTKSLGHSETLSESESQESTMFTWEGKKIRKNYGKSHPLAKLEGTYKGSIRSTPFYSTM